MYAKNKNQLQSRKARTKKSQTYAHVRGKSTQAKQVRRHVFDKSKNKNLDPACKNVLSVYYYLKRILYLQLN